MISKISEIELKECKGSMNLWDGKTSERINIQLRLMFNINITKENHNIVVNFINKIQNINYLQLELYSKSSKNEIIKIIINEKDILPNSELLFKYPYCSYNYIDLTIFQDLKTISIFSKTDIELNIVTKNNIDLLEIDSKNEIINNNEIISNNKIAVICDDLTWNSLQGIFDVTYISANINLNEFIPKNFDMLLCDTVWNGIDNSWKFEFSKFKKNNKLDKIINSFKKQNIPVVLYNKEDPTHFETFKNVYFLFDTIITSEDNLINDYKAKFPEKNIVSSPFNINPINHNILNNDNIKINDQDICFLGGFYNKFKERSSEQVNIFKNLLSKKKNIVIFDRNFYTNRKSEQILKHHSYRNKYNCPSDFYLYILPPIPPSMVNLFYKKYKYHINLNTVQQSNTMCSRRAIELIGCNKKLITNYNRCLYSLFEKNIIGDISVPFNTLSDTDYDNYYYIHKNLTYEKLICSLLKFYNIDIKYRLQYTIISNENIDSDIFNQNKNVDFKNIRDNESQLNTIKLNKPNYFYSNSFISDLLIHTKYFDGNIIINNGKYKDFEILDYYPDNLDGINKNSNKTLVINDIYNKLYSNIYSYDKEFSEIKLDTTKIEKGVSVVMCLWKRIELLPSTLKNLGEQDIDLPINLFLWNNNKDINQKIIDIIGNYKSNKVKIYLHNCENNIGGIGRFVMSKYLKQNISHFDEVIFIDDDQILDKDVIRLLYEQYKKNKNLSYHWYGRIFKTSRLNKLELKELCKIPNWKEQKIENLVDYEWDNGNITKIKKIPVRNNVSYMNALFPVMSHFTMKETNIRAIECYPNMPDKDYLDYGATGCMIIDSKIFVDNRFFKFNKKYAFIEDLWMSFFAQKYYGIKMILFNEIKNKVKNISDGKNQTAKNLFLLKNEFLDLLRKDGEWEV